MKFKDEDIEAGNQSADCEARQRDLMSTTAADTYSPRPDAYFVLMTMRLVSELTGLSPRTIKRLVFAGKFPEPVLLSNRREAWRKSDVLAFLAGHSRFPPSDPGGKAAPAPT